MQLFSALVAMAVVLVVDDFAVVANLVRRVRLFLGHGGTPLDADVSGLKDRLAIAIH